MAFTVMLLAAGTIAEIAGEADPWPFLTALVFPPGHTDGYAMLQGNGGF